METKTSNNNSYLVVRAAKKLLSTILNCFSNS